MLRYDKTQCILPFKAVSDDTLLGRGGSSTVHKISDYIVLKTPHNYLVDPDGPQRWRDETEDAKVCLEQEKMWYQEFDKNPHPYRLQSFMATKEGIFLPRMQTTLKEVLNGAAEPLVIKEVEAATANVTVSIDLKRRWAVEIASAAASLEALGLAQCDIKPRNVFIDSNQHTKLGDFDAVTRYGDWPPLIPPDWIWYDTCTSAQHDLFPIGETLWELFNGKEYDWGTPEHKNSIPDTSGVECGNLIDRCWRRTYLSITELESDLRKHLLDTQYGTLAPLAKYLPLSGLWSGAHGARILRPREIQQAQQDIENFLVSQAYIG